MVLRATRTSKEVYERLKNDPTLFHFASHDVFDLPEALTVGRERLYLQHFHDKLGYKPTAGDAEHFARAYQEPRAMRAGFDLYRAFEQDAADTRAAIEAFGKLKMPCLGLYGQVSLFGAVTEEMGLVRLRRPPRRRGDILEEASGISPLRPPPSGFGSRFSPKPGA